MLASIQSTMSINKLNVSQVLKVVGIVLVLFLVFFNLTDYPTTWFDEGSHLHVPKTLVRFGVYADYSSDGFRYYGPTLGVGPTVMLPIAAVFKLFGIGFLQARLVMALYLLATIWVFFRLAQHLGGDRLAWVASALMITSRGTLFLELGRQLLGEVPGLFFLIAGLLVWFKTWEQSSLARLFWVGILLGLSVVTKMQNLIVIAPMLIIAWLSNWFYYRTAPSRIFIVPGIVTAVCFFGWQAYLVLYLGPATAVENLTALRQAVAGAALVFSPQIIEQNMRSLVSLAVYLGALVPVLIYGLFYVLPRQRDRQQWSVLLIAIAVNVVWYVVASVGWIRYAFLGLVLTAFFAARFFYDLTDGFNFALPRLTALTSDWQKQTLRWSLLLWLVGMLLLPLSKTLTDIIKPPFNAPAAMSQYLNANLSKTAIIETWEPEMSFLTDHNYHFPPAGLLAKAVAYVWQGGLPPALGYDYIQTNLPDFVLVGEFAKSVDFYPTELLARYVQVKSIGAYDLYALRK